MTLRLRILLLIALVMMASIALGALVAGWEVRRALDAELAAGMAGARQTVTSAFEDLPHSDHPERDLGQLIATFDGNRHVAAALRAADGRLLAQSRGEAVGPLPPGWFREMVEVVPPPLVLAVPQVGGKSAAAVVLTPTPGPDVRSAWSEFVALVLVVAAAASAGLLLVHPLIGRALQPLTQLSAQFREIGAGDYSVRVREAGPPEIAQLQAGFNRMAEALEASTRRNRQLGEQLTRLQEEERADIARDLHDEIGPYLFAVNLDAGLIAQLGEAGQHDAIPERAREIQSAVRYMQRQVRDLLGLLRPTRLTEFGLAAAIDDLVRFWTVRHPSLRFELALPEGPLPETGAEVVYRVIQESVNNAVRHGQPGLIRLAVIPEGERWLKVTVEDDGARRADPAIKGESGGLGLIGMRERVEAGGGTLVFGPRAEGPLGDGPGWRVEARIGVEGR